MLLELEQKINHAYVALALLQNFLDSDAALKAACFKHVVDARNSMHDIQEILDLLELEYQKTLKDVSLLERCFNAKI